MKVRWSTCWVACALAGQAVAYPLTPGNVAHDLARRPARTVVAEMDRNGRYDKILDFIGAGDLHWLALAPQLAQGADAGTSESLTIALAEALPKRPVAVLAVIQPGHVGALAVDNICGAPFIEPPPKKLATYLKSAIRSVSAVSSAGASEARAACLDMLKRVQAMP